MRTKELQSKQQRRAEKRRKKLEALVNVAQLNDQDILAKKMKTNSCEEMNGLVKDVQKGSGDQPCKAFGNSEEKKIVKPLVIGEEYKDMKKYLSERKKLLKCQPRITLNETGATSSLQEAPENRIPLFLSDIQDLLVYLATHNTFYKPRWCTLEKVPSITKLNVFVLEGLSLEDYLSYEYELPVLKEFAVALEVLMPSAYGGDLLQELNSVPLMPSHQRRLEEEYGSLDFALQSNLHLRYSCIRALFPVIRRSVADHADLCLPEQDKFPRTELLLSAWQLVQENYPVPLKGTLRSKYKHYVQTKEEYSEVHEGSPMYAVDCEMVKTTTGQHELTRVTVVNENMDVIYDALVKPYNRIIDYLTQFSGMTKALLDPVTTRLWEVQQKLRALLPTDAILVGQSLNSDLHALQMMHPYVIDTSVIFNISGLRSKKTKLVTLAREFLGETIQAAETGHCSAEDSSACMKLIKLKLSNSVEFGDAVLVGRATVDTHINSLKNKKSAPVPAAGTVPTPGAEHKERCHVVSGRQLTTSLLFQVAAADKRGTVVGTQDVVNGYSDLTVNKSDPRTKRHVHGVVTGTTNHGNQDAVARAVEALPATDVCITHVRLNATQSTPNSHVNEWTQRLLEATPTHGACVVVMGNGASGHSGACFVQFNQAKGLAR